VIERSSTDPIHPIRLQGQIENEFFFHFSSESPTVLAGYFISGTRINIFPECSSFTITHLKELIQKNRNECSSMWEIDFTGLDDEKQAIKKGWIL
jgi:hypothetical protein